MLFCSSLAWAGAEYRRPTRLQVSWGRLLPNPDSSLAVPSSHGPVGLARWVPHDRLPLLGEAASLPRPLPSRPQRCDLLAAPPCQGPRQEEFKRPQEKPPAIDPRVRLPERSRAFIKAPGHRGGSSPFLLPFFCLPSHFPGLGPPSPEVIRRARRVTERRDGERLCLPPLSCRSLSRQAPGVGVGGHSGPQAFEQIFESWRSGVGMWS